jgi:hypothetical protein
MNVCQKRVQIQENVSDAQAQRVFEGCRANHSPVARPALAASASQRRSNGTAMGYEGCLTDNYSCITVLLTGSLLLRP